MIHKGEDYYGKKYVNVFSENGEVTAVPAFDSAEEELKHYEEEQKRKEQENKHKAPVFSENGELE